MLPKNYYSYLCVICLLCSSPNLEAQKTQSTLALEEVLELARERSLEAFRAKRQYALEHWRHRSFKASLLPSLNLNLEPFTYNRSFVERYDPDLNADVYRLQQNLNSYAQLSLNQNILWTGASVYLSSSFDRLVNYGDYQFESYNTTPLRIGIVQPIMAYNPLKWRKKTALLELEKAKKDFIAQQQEINIQSVSIFFQWALASAKVDMARENKTAAERLYEIGKKRYELGSIEKDELLNLELESFTSSTELTQYQQELETIISDLKLFLNLSRLPATSPELPEMLPKLKIDLIRAEKLVHRNNPDLLDAQIREIQAEGELDKAKKENRFDFSINASYGLNQQADELEDAYGRFLDQQIVAVRFSMPLLDWGERKGNIKMAKMTRELEDIQIEQDKNDIARQLMLTVSNFNLQEEQVLTAMRARDIAEESYRITERRFLSGQVDLLRLTNSRNAWQSTTEKYVQNLQLYWQYYYEVQQMTLYNFRQNITLSEDFDALLRE